MPLAGHDLFHNAVNYVGNISTPMPLAGHDLCTVQMRSLPAISTPMPLAGHDTPSFSPYLASHHFYSHAPRGA